MKDRKLSRKQIENILNKGILTPQQAKEAGLADVIAYEQEAFDDIGKGAEKSCSCWIMV